MFNIVDHRYWFFAISAIVLVPGIIALILWGLPLSIDFTGGAVYEVALASGVTNVEAGIRDVYQGLGVGEVQVVEARDPATGEVRYQIRSGELTPAQKEMLDAGLRERFGDFTELLFDSVGGTVGEMVTRSAAIAVAMAAVAILAYLTVQFRSLEHSIRYGVCAIIAMLHDVFVVLGVAALMGHFFGWQVDALFLTALLTVIGFSVHDSIVVFDRIRENVSRLRGLPYDEVVNLSIVQTLDRSINTQLTAFFTLFAINIYSSGQLEAFTFWLILGLISGTYSSIFNAAPLLVVWENKDWQHWFGRGGEATAAA